MSRSLKDCSGGAFRNNCTECQEGFLFAEKRQLKEAERELGVSSKADVEKSTDRSYPGMDVIVVKIGEAFAKAVVDKYGDPFVDWLARKL